MSQYVLMLWIELMGKDSSQMKMMPCCPRAAKEGESSLPLPTDL